MMNSSTENVTGELCNVLEFDDKKLAENIPLVAAALRNEGLSEGQIRAALLAICGVRVEESLVRLLMRFR